MLDNKYSSSYEEAGSEEQSKDRVMSALSAAGAEAPIGEVTFAGPALVE